jgi:uncharacterized membrane protein YbhN (UPF0104 family)
MSRRVWFKRLVGALFFTLLAVLLVREARLIEWHSVWHAARAYPWPVLLTAAAMAASSLLLYSCFDLLGRRYTGHTLSTPAVMHVTFISYVFNLNLGSLVGALALRYRLYSRLGLGYATITRVLSLSMLSNWQGYVLLAGAVFSLHPLALPPTWGVSGAGLRWLGLALLALGLAYLLLCAFSKRRQITLRGYPVCLPTWRMALLQSAMGMGNWLLMSGILVALLPQQIAWSMVVSTLLVAALAGVIAHVPAGLGVLEAVFVAMLSPPMLKTELLAALLVYRVIYHLAPLLLATLLYGVAEARRPRGQTA